MDGFPETAGELRQRGAPVGNKYTSPLLLHRPAFNAMQISRIHRASASGTAVCCLRACLPHGRWMATPLGASEPTGLCSIQTLGDRNSRPKLGPCWVQALRPQRPPVWTFVPQPDAFGAFSGPLSVGLRLQDFSAESGWEALLENASR